MRLHHIIELFVLESQKSDSTSEDRDRPDSRDTRRYVREAAERKKYIARLRPVALPVADENSGGRISPPLNKTEVVGCLA